MSKIFVHCPDCQCAYDAACVRGCPGCGTSLGESGDFGHRVIEAADHLAALLGGASDTELDALRGALGRELGSGDDGSWRRPLLQAIHRRTDPTQPAALVVAPRAGLVSVEQQRTAASAALLFAALTRLAHIARPSPASRPSLRRRALGLARRAFSVLSPAT